MLLLQVIVMVFMLIFFSVLAVVMATHLIQEVTGRAPFIPISMDVLPAIVDALKLYEGSVLYDLGSGDGRVVIAAALSNPTVKAIGVERSYLPFVVSSIDVYRKAIQNASFIRANFFDVDLKDASHVFLYLLPGLMNSLLPKLQKELKPGTRVVTCDFKFKDKQPVQIIDLHRKSYDLGRKIYIYEF